MSKRVVVPMSKQVPRVNIVPEICMETGLPTGRIMKYIAFVNPSTSCKTEVTISNNTYTMQELVKEVTLKNHMDLQFCMELSFLLGGI